MHEGREDKFVKIVNDIVGTGLLQLLAGGVAIGYAAGECAGAKAHLNIHRHVAYYQRFRRLVTKLPHGFKDGFRVGLCMCNVASSKHIGEILGNSHIPQKVVQGLGAPGRGHGQDEAGLMHFGKRIRNPRKELRDNLSFHLVKDLPVNYHPRIKVFRTKLRVHGHDALL